MRQILRQFWQQRWRHLLWGAAIATAVSFIYSVYMIDFEHRYDERFQDTERQKGESDAAYNKRLTVEQNYYSHHYGWEFFENIELKLYDMRFRARGPLPAREDIVIIAMDTPSFDQVSVWPWPWHLYGDIVKRLGKAGAKVIAFDILFSDPQTTGANEVQRFREAIKAIPGKVILSSDFDEEESDQRLQISPQFPIPELDEFAHDVGITRMPEDSDNSVRSFAVYLRHLEPIETTSGEIKDGWNLYPSFATAVAGKGLGLTPDQIRANLKKGVLGKVRIPFVASIRDTERPLHTHTALLNFTGPARHFRTHSFFEALDPTALSDADLREIVKDKIVLIGASAAVLHDIFPTPFKEYGRTPGIEIHANAMQTLLNGQFIRTLPRTVNLATLFLMSLLTALLTVTISKPVSSFATLIDAKLSVKIGNFRLRTYGITWFLLYFGCGLLPLAIGYWEYAFITFQRHDIWVPLAYPLMAMTVSYLLCVAYMFLTEEQEKKKMLGRFQRFVAPTVLTQILANPAEEYPKPRRVEATLVFTDLQGFTTLSEANEPEVVVMVLNEYLTRMTHIIFKYQGTIDKYIGDAIMVIFGAPVPFPDHAERAMRTAIEMQEECARFREYAKTQGWPDFWMRIGVHSGRPMVGSIGSEDRLDYTAIGDDVNLAARLEGLNKQYGSWIMCSSITNEYVKDFIISEFVPAAQVKGKTSAVDVYKVFGLKEVGRRDHVWGEGAGGKEEKH